MPLLFKTEFLSNFYLSQNHQSNFRLIDIYLRSGKFLPISVVFLHRLSHIIQLMQGCFITANSSSKLFFAIFSKYIIQFSKRISSSKS